MRRPHSLLNADQLFSSMEFMPDCRSDKCTRAGVTSGFRSFLDLALIISAHPDRDPGGSDPGCMLLHEKTLYILRGLPEAFRDAAAASFHTKSQRQTTVEQKHRSVRRHNANNNRALAVKKTAVSNVPFMFHYQFSAPRNGFWADSGLSQVVAICRRMPKLPNYVENCRLLSQLAATCRMSALDWHEGLRIIPPDVPIPPPGFPQLLEEDFWRLCVPNVPSPSLST